MPSFANNYYVYGIDKISFLRKTTNIYYRFLSFNIAVVFTVVILTNEWGIVDEHRNY